MLILCFHRIYINSGFIPDLKQIEGNRIIRPSILINACICSFYLVEKLSPVFPSNISIFVTFVRLPLYLSSVNVVSIPQPI